MAILPYNEYTAATGIDFGDVFHIQRQEPGWTDHKVRNRNMFGVELASYEQTYDIQTLISGPVVFYAAPGTGNIWMPIRAHAIYSPGNTADNAAIRLIGHIDFESGGTNGMCAGFQMTSSASGSTLRSSDTAILYSGIGTMTFRINDPTTADGRMRIFVAFSKLTL